MDLWSEIAFLITVTSKGDLKSLLVLLNVHYKKPPLLRNNGGSTKIRKT